MIFSIYKKALEVLAKKPFVLWGISLLELLLAGLGSALFGIIPGVALAITWLLNTSMTLIFLHGYRGRDVRTLQLFDSFRDWTTIKRVLAGMGWSALWVFIWGLIPVVGPIFSIIRAYEYRLVPYILMQEPGIKPTDARLISRQRTNGWKVKMFWADILIYICIGVIALILGLLSRIRYIGVLFGIINALFILCCVCLLHLFRGLVKAAFYEEIKAACNNVNQCPACLAYVAPGCAFCPSCGARFVPVQPAPIVETPAPGDESAEATEATEEDSAVTEAEAVSEEADTTDESDAAAEGATESPHEADYAEAAAAPESSSPVVPETVSLETAAAEAESLADALSEDVPEGTSEQE